MKRKKVFLLFFTFLSLFSFFVFAQEVKYPTAPGVSPPTATTTFPEYIRYFFNLLVAIIGIVAFGVLIWGAVLWLISAGDPEAKARAKGKIMGAFLGLFLLLSSYIIITAINPKLSFFRLREFAASGGVYLIKASGEKEFIPNTNQKLDLNNVQQIEFVSSPQELIEVYLYDKENFKGNKEKIENPGAGTSAPISTISNPKSIYFVWANPGIYLYDDTNFNLVNFSYPLYVLATRRDLVEWGEEVKSMRVIDYSNEIHKGAVLFSGKLDGECGFVFTTTTICDRTFISDLSSTSSVTGCGVYDNEYGMDNDKLNSLLLFTIDANKTYSGSVTFYDKIDCTPSARTLTISPSLGVTSGEFNSYVYLTASGTTSTWEGKIESFKVDGPFKVILIASSSKGWICQAGWKEDSRRCVGRLEGTAVYSINSTSIRPTAFYIISGQ
jgi:hypothetical protein